ncbi:hypothetical protein [Stutzerimonas xanthomarina]|uniref:hypothetical protein n=1 Tax=Stutzerimonas xanthomarina TaxID=271420 RepID=UPI003AA7D703
MATAARVVKAGQVLHVGRNDLGQGPAHGDARASNPGTGESIIERADLEVGIQRDRQHVTVHLPMSWRRIASSASMASKSFFKRLLNMQGIQSIWLCFDIGEECGRPSDFRVAPAKAVEPTGCVPEASEDCDYHAFVFAPHVM